MEQNRTILSVKLKLNLSQSLHVPISVSCYVLLQAQLAFRKFHYTLTFLLTVHNIISFVMENNKVTVCISLSLTAAFTAVSHTILLRASINQMHKCAWHIKESTHNKAVAKITSIIWLSAVLKLVSVWSKCWRKIPVQTNNIIITKGFFCK